MFIEVFNMTKELKRRGNKKYQKSVKYIPVPKIEELGLGKFYRLGERKVAENAVRKYSIYDSKTKTFTDISEDEFNERKNKRYKRS